MPDDKELCKIMMDLKDRTRGVEESTKSAHKRLDRHEETIASIHTIATNLETLTVEVKHAVTAFAKQSEQITEVKSEVKEIKKDVQDLKNRPANEALEDKRTKRKAIVYAVVATLVCTAFGFLGWLLGANY